MPSGRFDSNTPASSATLTPPCSTVRPRTNVSHCASADDHRSNVKIKCPTSMFDALSGSS